MILSVCILAVANSYSGFYMHVQCAFSMHFDNLKLLLRLLATCITCISVSTLILTISQSSMRHTYVYVGCLNLLLRFSYIISGVGKHLGMGGQHRGCVAPDSVSVQSVDKNFALFSNCEEAVLVASQYIEGHELTSCILLLSLAVATVTATSPLASKKDTTHKTRKTLTTD